MKRGVALVLVCASACSLLTSLDDLGGAPDAEAGADSATDALFSDAAGDAGADSDAGDLADLARWSSFDLTSLGGTPAGFWGGTFDGRYVYLTPSTDYLSTSEIIYRYDTQAAFSAAAGWSKLNLSTTDVGATNFAGAAFDGRYVYLAPTWSATVTERFDTQAPFTQTSSWTQFDGGAAFTHRQGAAFDGHFVYFAPITNVVSRYDTTQSFTAAASWAEVDVSTFSDAGATYGFTGAIDDGRYVYFLPPSDDFGNTSGSIVLRYDTQAAFGAPASWSSFDVAQVSSSAAGFAGGAFDGRYVYAVPNRNGEDYDGLVLRYDTQATFGAVSSWETFDAATLSTQCVGFSGAVYDGRYVYFSPRGFGNTGVLARYDTQAAFSLASSWATFDTHAVDVTAGGFLGAIFDGEYVYFVPGSGHVTVRFDARKPPITPPERGGSFF